MFRKSGQQYIQRIELRLDTKLSSESGPYTSGVDKSPGLQTDRVDRRGIHNQPLGLDSKQAKGLVISFRKENDLTIEYYKTILKQ